MVAERISSSFGEGDRKNTFASVSKDHTRQVPEEKTWLRVRRGWPRFFFFFFFFARREDVQCVWVLGKRKSRDSFTFACLRVKRDISLRFH